jgi:hypothetical protein
MNKEKKYNESDTFNINNNDFRLESVIENVWKILKSRFKILDNKFFFNIKWDKLICKFVNNKRKWKKIFLENEKWEMKSYLDFSYMEWCYYIDSLVSYDNRKWNWRLILDLFINTAKWTKIFLQDNAYLRDNEDDSLNIRLKNFYKKRGFNKSKIGELQRCNVLFKWDVNEWRIYYKYF